MRVPHPGMLPTDTRTRATLPSVPLIYVIYRRAYIYTAVSYGGALGPKGLWSPLLYHCMHSLGLFSSSRHLIFIPHIFHFSVHHAHTCISLDRRGPARAGAALGSDGPQGMRRHAGGGRARRGRGRGRAARAARAGNRGRRTALRALSYSFTTRKRNLTTPYFARAALRKNRTPNTTTIRCVWNLALSISFLYGI